MPWEVACHGNWLRETGVSLTAPQQSADGIVPTLGVGKARTVGKGSSLQTGVPHARPGSRVESESWR
jgi:hypothetical protein